MRNLTVEPRKYTILFVDDEASILRSMKRLFHSKPFKMVLADTPAKALAYMAEHPVHVIISDMKMPGMSGTEFLAQVSEKYPDTYRMVLSGFADLESTLEVINHGKIQRFMQKPWDNDELIAAVEQGVEYYRLKDENERLHALSMKQNKQLVKLNDSLEQKVEQRNLQTRSALVKAEQGSVSIRKVLQHIMSLHPSLDNEFAKLVGKLSERLAQHLKLDAKAIADINYACSIHQIGGLGIDPKLLGMHFGSLSPKQQTEFFEQINHAQLIMSPAPDLQGISDILAGQYEYVNGQGNPNGLKDEQIPIGAKIIAVARDYLLFTMGTMDGKEYNPNVALGKMAKLAGLQYSSAVIEALEAEVNEDDMPDDGAMKSHQVTPGMILEEAIYNDKDILILPEGHEFDDASIEKLKSLEERFSMSFKIYVKQ